MIIMAKEFNTVKKLFGDNFSEVTNEELMELFNWKKLTGEKCTCQNISAWTSISVRTDGGIDYRFEKDHEPVIEISMYGWTYGNDYGDDYYENTSLEIKRDHYSRSRFQYPKRILEINDNVNGIKREVKFNLWSNVKNPKKILERVITIELN